MQKYRLLEIKWTRFVEFIQKHLGLFAGIMGLAVLLLVVGFFSQLREYQLQERLDIIQRIDYAEKDFNNALLHLALSSSDSSPWDSQIGTQLLKQSLNSYRQIHTSLPVSQNAENFITAIELLSSKIISLSDRSTLLEPELRQNIFEMRQQINVLEQELRAQLQLMRAEQISWFIYVLSSSLFLLLLMTLTLMRSRRIRKNLGFDLRDRQALFFKLMQHSNDVFWIEDFDTQKLMYVSGGFKRFTGMARREVLDKKAIWKKLLSNDNVNTLEKLRVKAALSEQFVELDYTHPDSRQRYFLMVSIFPIWSNDEETKQTPDYIAAVIRDVSKKKLYERNLRQKQRMDSLGKLTGGVSHDFNNLLTVILNNAEVLSKKVEKMPQLQNTVDLIIRASRRGQGLTEQLSSFSRQQKLSPQRTLVSELINDSVSLLLSTFGDKYHFDIQQDEPELYLNLDQGQFQNALLNLCINSRDAMPQGGVIIIRVSTIGTEQLDSLDVPGIKLIIKDSGHGMSQETTEQIFDPFFTTKEMDGGSGLGLSMVYGFVRQSGGKIRVDSTLNKGTTMHITLPQTL